MGFTITELLVAAAISLITVSVAGQAMISHLETTQNSEAIERQRNDWSRTSKFIESEISLSERIFSDYDLIVVPNDCSIDQSEFRMALDMRRDLPIVIYGVKTSDSEWLGDNSLWRCGPSFNDDGSYNADLIDWSLIVDGLSSAASGGGFAEISNSGGKHTQLSLSIKGLADTNYNMTIGARARINKLYSQPNVNSLCNLNTLKISGSVDTADSLDSSDYGALSGNLLICGMGGADTIVGTAQRDIIEAGDQGASSLSGAGGHDHLRGTNDSDTISGGDGDDVLIGRDGNDNLNGGSGENSYLPGDGDDTITGGSGLDIVFIDGNISDFAISSPCNNTTCTITRNADNTDKENITEGEIVIFDDARLDLE